MQSVLVLNSTFEPLNSTSIKRAMQLVLAGKAEVLSDRGVIRTISLSFPLPSVIRRLTYIKQPRRQVALTKENLFRRDNHTCQYCGARDRRLTIDHVIPKSCGGSLGWDNVVAACESCNTRKDNRTPAQAGMQLSRKPRKPHYVFWINLKIGVPEDWHAWFFDARINEEICA